MMILNDHNIIWLTLNSIYSPGYVDSHSRPKAHTDRLSFLILLNNKYLLVINAECSLSLFSFSTPILTLNALNARIQLLSLWQLDYDSTITHCILDLLSFSLTYRLWLCWPPFVTSSYLVACFSLVYCRFAVSITVFPTLFIIPTPVYATTWLCWPTINI